MSVPYSRILFEIHILNTSITVADFSASRTMFASLVRDSLEASSVMLENVPLIVKVALVEVLHTAQARRLQVVNTPFSLRVRGNISTPTSAVDQLEQALQEQPFENTLRAMM